MQIHTLALAASLALAGPAHAVSLYESGGHAQFVAGTAASNLVGTGSSSAVGGTFTLAQRSMVERIVFGSTLVVPSGDPLQPHGDAVQLGIRSLHWVPLGGASISGPGVTLAAGGSVSLGGLVAPIAYNLVSVPVSLLLDAGTYLITWDGAPSDMPTFAVPGASVELLSPLGGATLNDTSLLFEVQGVSAVPEPHSLALLLAGLAGLGGLAARRQHAAGRRVSR